MNTKADLRRDFLGTVAGEIVVHGTQLAQFPIALDVYGHRVGSGLDSCLVVDRVELEKNDISVELPSEALECITAYMNEVHK